MPALTVTAQRNAYIGWSKQSVWGTPVAPAFFWRWLDGTDANPEIKMTKEREGDTSPFLNLTYKNSQIWKIVIKERVRPITAGCAFQALLGTASDTYTAPAFATTLSASVVAGATSFSSTANLGNVGASVPMAFTPGYASTVYEDVLVNAAGRTGTGPYTYPLVAGQAFVNAHASGDAVNTGATHTMQRQNTTYDPYTLEFAFPTVGSAFTGKAIRIQDCVCVEVKLTAEKGKALELQHTWYGSLSVLQAAFLTPTFEGTNVVGPAGSPLVFYHAANNWSLDNLTTGNATSITKLDLTLKNTTGDADLQNELLYPQYFLQGNMDIDGTLDVHFQNYNQYYEMYYGNTASPAANATDDYHVGYGQIATTFATDAINSLRVSLPNVAYTAGKLTPKLDAKPLTQSIAFSAVKTPAFPNPLSIILNNTQTSAY